MKKKENKTLADGFGLSLEHIDEVCRREVTYAKQSFKQQIDRLRKAFEVQINGARLVSGLTGSEMCAAAASVHVVEFDSRGARPGPSGCSFGMAVYVDRCAVRQTPNDDSTRPRSIVPDHQYRMVSFIFDLGPYTEPNNG